MDAEQWQQIERIYDSVVRLEPERRQGFLRDACAGDEFVLREVERLLKRQQEAEEFLESPALELAAKELVQDQIQLPQPDLAGRVLAHCPDQFKCGRFICSHVYDEPWPGCSSLSSYGYDDGYNTHRGGLHSALPAVPGEQMAGKPARGTELPRHML